MASCVSDGGSRKQTAVELVGGIHCHICRLALANKKEFDYHYMSHSTGTEVITYTCVACHFTFTSYPTFRGHCYNMHIIKDRYKCKHCNKRMSKPTALEEHIKTMHTFKCNTCDKEFPSKKELNLHSFVHKEDANKPPYPCHTCGAEILSIQMCEDHIDKHCSFVYNCPICNEILTKEDASKHLVKHFGDDQTNEDTVKDLETEEMPEDCSVNIVGGILCCHCRKLFKNRIEIDAHIAEDHPGKEILYTCNICGKQYEKYNRFGDHSYYHYSKNKFVCEYCQKPFPRLSLLVAHVEAHTSTLEVQFPCSLCPKVFQSPKRLREHEITQHKLQTLLCSEPGCCAEFESPKELILHRKRHTAISSSAWCRRCGLQLATAGAAERHLPVHRTAKLQCAVCSKTYAEKHLLMKHAIQHFESVLHMCKICCKVFTAKSRLIEHAKTHASIKSYECEVCGKGFLRPYKLSQHLNIHTGARPFCCTVCPKKFASQPNLAKHLKRMHDPNKPNKKTAEKNTMRSEEKKMSTSEFGSDDSTMDSEMIDSTVLEQEAKIYESQVQTLSSVELTILPQPTEFVSETSEPPLSSAMPREYGPDFGDELMPHIDPQLINNLHSLTELTELSDLSELADIPACPTLDAPKWEPIITRVYGCYTYQDPLINTDIF